MPPRKACDICFKRKIQCSIPAQGGPCDWCAHQGLDCTFLREPQKKNQDSVTPDEVRGLYRRVAHLENELGRIASFQHTPNVDATPRTSDHSGSIQIDVSPDSTLHSTTTCVATPQYPVPASSRSETPRLHELFNGLNWYYNGMPILSQEGREWIVTRTDQPQTLDKFLIFNRHKAMINSASSPREDRVTRTDQTDLPAEQLTLQTLNFLAESFPRKMMPELDRDVLMEIVSRAYQGSTNENLAAKACVWALHAFASCWNCTQIAGTLDESDMCASKAEGLLGLLREESTIDILHAIMLLYSYHASLGHWRRCSFLMFHASQTICDLGGHIFHSPETTTSIVPSDTDDHRRLVRNLFWACYVLDKETSLRSGRAPSLTEDYCDLTLPNSDERFLTLSHDPLISMIKERVSRLLYSPQAHRDPESHLLLNIRQLDDDLEQWRLSLPPSLRPKLSIPMGNVLLSHEVSNPRAIVCMQLQLEYHYTLACIHTTVERCGFTGENGSLPDYLHTVLHSSTDRALEAGRSTLTFLGTSVGSLQEGAFPYICSYAPVAAMSLFIHILTHPRHARAQTDVETMFAATRTIQSIPLKLLGNEQIKRVQEIHDFIMELTRLGTCAMWKAKKEEGY